MNKLCDPSFFLTPHSEENDGPLEVLTVETYIGLPINSYKARCCRIKGNLSVLSVPMNYEY